MFTVKQPINKGAPLFTFDSLNVSYEGSWGFGQSFSISSDNFRKYRIYRLRSGCYHPGCDQPRQPVKLSEISARGLVDAIYFDEAANRLYLCAYFAGFEIWDVSDIAAPVRTWRRTHQRTAQGRDLCQRQLRLCGDRCRWRPGL